MNLWYCKIKSKPVHVFGNLLLLLQLYIYKFIIRYWFLLSSFFVSSYTPSCFSYSFFFLGFSLFTEQNILGDKYICNFFLDLNFFFLLSLCPRTHHLVFLIHFSFLDFPCLQSRTYLATCFHTSVLVIFFHCCLMIAIFC